ncbi:mago-bind domain protein [Rhizoctonia solani AG-3 Rhs1AP]|uniref:Mago-bind domain protein n=2 Tax=Rhizoctonia solani AG-3 TaxID=1086053 RepID=A0A074S3E3_9AGAM|nr:mago-bind domain protein [Rhizoctonia solani AG-3 Rhs1AP]KEP52085.1 mago-bind domain protein [Rhizoctonia solani 123E]
MSLPPLNPEKTASGISVDPRTLDRVVASTRRADGSVRKELKIRPGFTPQEDVGRFRGSRQQASDKNTLPKGHIVGWVAPSSETKPKPKPAEMTKAQKKNAKRAEKRAEKRTQPVAVKENWDDDDEDEEIGQGKPAGAGADNASDSKAEPTDVDAVTKEIGELKV